MSRNKIKSLKALQKITASLRRQGKKTVFTNGCFDILHYGHIKYLEDAKRKGDILIVAINSDASVKKIKGASRPIVPEKDRLRVLAGLESVDYVVAFSQETPLETIMALKPDILAKGADWKNNIVGSDFVKRHGGRACAIKLVPGRSTTKIIKKIAEIH